MANMAGKTKLFGQILSLVLVWRLALFGLGVIADRFVAYDPSFPYAREMLAKMDLPRWLYSWGGFDGVHYLTIADNGYRYTAFVQAFFPVWPFMIRLFPLPLLAGLILNILLTALMALSFYQLARLDQSIKTARWSLAALLLFPTAFFFGALYTEAFFLLLVFGSFLMARQKQWLWAGLLAGLASGTRIIGVMLWPALLVELWLQAQPVPIKLFFKKHLKAILSLSLALVGLGLYMFYLWLTFGDPLYFFHVQSEFGAGRQQSLVLFPQAVWRYLKILWSARPFDWKYFSYAQDLVLSLGALGSLVIWWKKIRPSYLLFSLLAFFLPPLTGTLSSMPRYILVCFPLFLLLGELWAKRPVWRVFLLTVSVILLIINTILFIQGYWVA